MKINNLRCKPASIAKTRWASYASAATATALLGSQSAEAAIHYSGRINDAFGGRGDQWRTFTLDQPGDNFVLFRNYYYGDFTDEFFMSGIQSVAFRGGHASCSPRYGYVSRLTVGQRVSNGNFYSFPSFPTFVSGTLAAEGANCFKWQYKRGFIGFRFNNGAGVQYGWVRIRMEGGDPRGFPFWLLDYAYADPGEPIRTGQRSSDEQAPDQDSTDEQGPDEGSLGGLALGAVGLLAWRKSRSRTARSPQVVNNP